MRIAIVTPSVHRGGGTEKCLSWLIEDLSCQHDVTLFTGELRETDASHCRVHLLPMIRRPRLARYLSFLIANLAALLVDGASGRRFDVVLATGADCLLSDVVYAHFCCAAWLRMLRRGEVDLPSAALRQRAAAIHYVAFLWIASLVEAWIDRSPRVKAIMAVSEGTRAELIRHYRLDPRRVTVVTNAADESVRLSREGRLERRRDTRARHDIPGTSRVLLFVAAGDWKRKGLRLVLEALATLDDPTVHLLVVGRDDVPFYAREARAMGLRPSNVHFAGFQQRIEDYYAAADVFVYPSAYEALSLVTLEAAAAGLPLVVTPINGTAELVRHGENGFLIKPDPSEIAGILRLLLDDPQRRESMAAAARASSLSFTRSAVLQATVALCESVFGTPVVQEAT